MSEELKEVTFEFACWDDCLDKMVPSDLRKVVAERDALRAELEAAKKTNELQARIIGIYYEAMNDFSAYTYETGDPIGPFATEIYKAAREAIKKAEDFELAAQTEGE